MPGVSVGRRGANFVGRARFWGRPRPPLRRDRDCYEFYKGDSMQLAPGRRGRGNAVGDRLQGGGGGGLAPARELRANQTGSQSSPRRRIND